MKQHHMYSIMLLTVLLFSLGQLSFGQIATGELTGRIIDPAQAVVPGAEITVTNVETRVERKTLSNEQGYYIVSFLPPGNYEVSASLQGFKRTSQSGIRLGPGERLNISVSLELGAVDETVTVSATTQQVNTEDGKLRHVVDQKQVEDLAINGRSLAHLVALVPGVALRADLNPFDTGSGSLGPYAVNGARTTYNAATIDGGMNQDAGDILGQSNVISPDFVQEVTIVTSGYSAEYGRNSGVQINFATRSGTREFHGVAYEFLRNDKLDARSFFAPRREKLRYNDFGWALGGPIFIPGKLNTSRDKLFFFAGQEYRRRIGDFITTATTPTSAERSGISNSRGQLRYPANFHIEALRGQPISDPSRGTPGNPNGLNIIPSQFIDPNGRAIMNIFQTMTGVAAVYADLPTSNNTVFQLRQPSRQREDIIKIDYHFSPTHQFTYTNLYDDVEADFPTFLGSYPTYGVKSVRRGRTNQLAWTHVISPRTVNRVRLHVNHLNLFNQSIDDFSRDISRYGFKLKELFGNDIQTVGIPRFDIQGFSPINGAQLPGQPPTTDISIADDFSHVRGNHNLKMGFLGIRNRKNERIFETRSIITGAISFSPAGNPNTTGDALADALLGNFQSWTESQRDIILKIRFTQLEGYLADTWKVRPNLSLDLGIRYSYTFPNRAVNNDVSTFVASLFRPEQARQVIPSGPGAGSLRPGIGDPFNGIVIPGDGFPEGFEQTFAGANDPAIRALFKGLPRSIFNNFSVLSPRIGFAYDPTRSGKFSIRGGAGIFTDILPTGFFAAGGTNPPFNAIRQVLNGRLEDPAGGNPAAEFPVNITGFLPNLEAPITYKMNFGIQRQMPFSSLLDVNYVTSQSRHNIRRVDFNLVHPAVRVANPGVNLNAIRRFPGYGSILLYESSASSNYHGLQMGLTRRYAKELTYSVAYTLSKALDDGSGNNSGVEDITNYRGERSHSDLDRNHVLMMSYVWEIPFGRTGNRWYEKVFGGWAISGINQFQTGPWLTPTIATPTGFRRPNRVGELTYLDPRQVRTLTGGDGQPSTGNFYFDPGPAGAFVAPPADRFGNSAPNIIRGPGRNNWNVALMKDFRLKGEDIKLKFRAEAFNIWNHVQFNNPNTTVSDRAFGTISSSALGRNIQLGLKLEF